MLNYFCNIIRLAVIWLSFVQKIRFQKSFVNKFFNPLIDKYRAANDGSLTEKDFERAITYATMIPALPGEAFCRLRGKLMTNRERESLTLLASLTGLFDDLFDTKELGYDEIRHMLLSPVETEHQESFKKMLIGIYGKALTRAFSPDSIKAYNLKVLEAQQKSKLQKNNTPEPDELRKITYDKGGYSIPVYRCALEGNPQSDYELLYRLGALGQLENDIFDVYKDLKDDISTLVTTTKSIRELRCEYNAVLDKVYSLIAGTGYPAKGQRRFRLMVSLIAARGMVALDVLERASDKTNGVFVPEKYLRKDLICDMEKPLNIFKLIHYAALSDAKSTKQ